MTHDDVLFEVRDELLWLQGMLEDDPSSEEITERMNDLLDKVIVEIGTSRKERSA